MPKASLKEMFQFGQEIGRGSFATVILATDRRPHPPGEPPTKYAMKVIDKAKCKGYEDHIVKEITILKQINHKNIIKLHECYETKDRLYLQMEYVDGGELFDRILNLGYYCEDDARNIVTDTLEAVQYLHAQNVVHRDLKPENLLMSSNSPTAEIKLADFGLSTFITQDNMLKTTCGTLTYVAPEILAGKRYGKPVDMWSIGIIAYILLSGYPPFWADDEAATLDLMLKAKFTFPSPDWDEISSTAKDFIRQLLQPDVAKRLTAEQALSHTWIIHGRKPLAAVEDGKQERVNLRERVGGNLRKHFNARRMLKLGLDTVFAVNALSTMGKLRSPLGEKSPVFDTATVLPKDEEISKEKEVSGDLV
ncbi:hypothetical protein SpCBS45565_g04295 [Spizellomyces sp. 'palustris']|nr:hypothetical protein SpCBS45565_g04295 [Spizellomyces sp. 'palustris']